MVFPACLSRRSILQTSDQPNQPSSKPSNQSVSQSANRSICLSNWSSTSVSLQLSNIYLYLSTSLYLFIYKGFTGGSNSKESTCSAEDWGSIPGSGRSLGKETANHISIFVWRIPWTEELGRSVGYSPWGRKELNMTEQLTLSFISILVSFLGWNPDWHPSFSYSGQIQVLFSFTEKTPHCSPFRYPSGSLCDCPWNLVPRPWFLKPLQLWAPCRVPACSKSKKITLTRWFSTCVCHSYQQATRALI